MSLSRVPIDILKGILGWIRNGSIDACMLRQTNTYMKWACMNHLGWKSLVNYDDPTFHHDLNSIWSKLPPLKRANPTNPTEMINHPSFDAAIKALKRTSLKHGSTKNFYFLRRHVNGAITDDEVSLPIEFGHLTCFTDMVAMWRADRPWGWTDTAGGLSFGRVLQGGFHAACQFGRLEILKWLQDAYATYLLPKSSLLPVSIACEYNQMEVLKYLVGEGFNIHNPPIRTVGFGTSSIGGPLSLACVSGNLEIVKYLCLLNVDIHDNNDQAVVMACSQGDLALVEFLYGLGADIRINDDLCFQLACQNGHMSVVLYLHSRGANINADQDAPIRYACRSGQLEVIEFLYAHGANIHSQTLVSIAANYNYLNVVTFLCSHGADIHTQDDKAIRVAYKYGYRAVVKFLYTFAIADWPKRYDDPNNLPAFMRWMMDEEANATEK